MQMILLTVTMSSSKNLLPCIRDIVRVRQAIDEQQHSPTLLPSTSTRRKGSCRAAALLGCTKGTCACVEQYLDDLARAEALMLPLGCSACTKY